MALLLMLLNGSEPWSPHLSIRSNNLALPDCLKWMSWRLDEVTYMKALCILQQMFLALDKSVGEQFLQECAKMKPPCDLDE